MWWKLKHCCCGCFGAATPHSSHEQIYAPVLPLPSVDLRVRPSPFKLLEEGSVLNFDGNSADVITYMGMLHSQVYVMHATIRTGFTTMAGMWMNMPLPRPASSLHVLCVEKKKHALRVAAREPGLPVAEGVMENVYHVYVDNELRVIAFQAEPYRKFKHAHEEYRWFRPGVVVSDAYGWGGGFCAHDSDEPPEGFVDLTPDILRTAGFVQLAEVGESTTLWTSPHVDVKRYYLYKEGAVYKGEWKNPPFSMNNVTSVMDEDGAVRYQGQIDWSTQLFHSRDNAFDRVTFDLRFADRFHAVPRAC